MTKEVLKERKLLEEKVNILILKLKDGINKVNELKEIIKTISGIKNDLNNSKIYVKTSKIPIIKRIDKNPNFYVTTCLICNKTCHSNCEIADDDDKKNVLQWTKMDIVRFAQKNVNGISTKTEIIYYKKFWKKKK